MLDVERSNQFKRDYKLAKKRRNNLGLLQEVVELLTRQEPLPSRHRPHKLSGDMAGFWECHVEPDFLLIYDYAPGKLKLMRLGTHADLFE